MQIEYVRTLDLRAITKVELKRQVQPRPKRCLLTAEGYLTCGNSPLALQGKSFLSVVIILAGWCVFSF